MMIALLNVNMFIFSWEQGKLRKTSSALMKYE